MWLRIGNKIYNGERIYCGKKEDIEIDVYCINPVHEKFLVIQKTNKESKDFVVTGMHRVHELMGIVDNGKKKASLELEIAKGLQKIMQQSTVKSLRKTDLFRLKELAASFYENNSVIFTILGINSSDFLKRAEKEAAS